MNIQENENVTYSVIDAATTIPDEDTRAWENVLNVITLQKMLFDMGLGDYLVDEIDSIEIFSKTRAGCRFYVKYRCNYMKAYVDFTLGEPTWELFTEVMYDLKKDADVMIIACSEENDDDIYVGYGYLARYFNECGVKVHMITGSNLTHLLYGNQEFLSITAVPDIDDEYANYEYEYRADENKVLPTKRQLQESEFWYGHYWPIWDPYYLSSGGLPMEFWINEPGYSLPHHCHQAVLWNDKGLMIKVSEPSGNGFINYLWEKGQDAIKNQFPDCEIIVSTDDPEEVVINFKVLDIPMSALIEMDCDKKDEYGSFVFEMEHDCVDIINELMDEYHKTKEPEACTSTR